MNRLRKITPEERILERYDNCVHAGQYRNLDQELNELFNKSDVKFDIIDYVSFTITVVLLISFVSLITITII